MALAKLMEKLLKGTIPLAHEQKENNLQSHLAELAPSVGQYIHQRYSHWLSPKPLSVLYCRNVCENLEHSNHLEKLCNKDSIYISLLTISVVA